MTMMTMTTAMATITAATTMTLVAATVTAGAADNNPLTK